MALIQRCWVLMLVGVALGSCNSILGQRVDDEFCAAHPDDPRCPGEAKCTASSACEAPLVCDIPSGACVECTQSEPQACSGVEPICGDDNTCRRCEVHAECGSAACGADGACIDENMIAYVAPGGSGTTATGCAKNAACPTLADAVAVTSKPYIKVTGAVIDNQETVIDRSVTILADPGAKLDRDNNGRILLVRGPTATVSIFDLEISGQTGTGDEAIRFEPNGGTGGAPSLTLVKVSIKGNQGMGISSTGGTLTVSQSSIAENPGGGITVSGGAAIFNITNTFIVRNGNSTTATTGGASLSGAVSGNVFAFNTVVDNGVRVGASAGGVSCDIPGFTAPNNIIVRNFVNNMPGMTNSNTNDVCTFPTSTVDATVTGLNFKSPDGPPLDYHIQPASSAIDQATTASTVNVDVDGQARPQGNAPDRGADEFKP